MGSSTGSDRWLPPTRRVTGTNNMRMFVRHVRQIGSQRCPLVRGRWTQSGCDASRVARMVKTRPDAYLVSAVGVPHDCKRRYRWYLHSASALVINPHTTAASHRICSDCTAHGNGPGGVPRDGQLFPPDAGDRTMTRYQSVEAGFGRLALGETAGYRPPGRPGGRSSYGNARLSVPVGDGPDIAFDRPLSPTDGASSAAPAGQPRVRRSRRRLGGDAHLPDGINNGNGGLSVPTSR